MNPADKITQELIQSLQQSKQTIQQLTEILSKSERRSQRLERTFHWLAILFICLTITVFYIGFDWINHAQATSGNETTAAKNDNPGRSKLTDEKNKFKSQRESCQQGMQLMMVKQAQDLMLTSLTLSKEMQQLPQSPEKDQMVEMSKQLGSKLNNIFPNMDNVFNDSSRIACDTVVQVMNITRKLEEFKADWNLVRDLLLKILLKTEKDGQKQQPDQQDPLYPVSKIILDHLRKKEAIDDNGALIKGKEFKVDSALSTYLAWGIMKGIASLDKLGGIQQALEAVPKMNTNMMDMNANMIDMNIHMYHMMRNMGVMTYDMDSTLGRAGRNMPWMPW